VSVESFLAVVTGPNHAVAQAGGAGGVQPQLESVETGPGLAANGARSGGLERVGAPGEQGG